MSFIVSLLSGPVLSAITGPILAAYKARLAATNTTDKLAVDLAMKEIEGEIDARRQAKEIIIAEQGRWWTAAPRALVTWSIAIFVFKVVVWDKVLGLGSTDPLTGDVAQWAGTVMAVWFGGRTIEKVARIFRR